MQLRKFVPQDAEELAWLFYQTIRNVNIYDYSDQQVVVWAPDLFNFNLEEWKKTFDNKFVIVAVDDQKLCGFGELELDGHVDRFYVHEKYIGSGVGRAIYESLEEYAIAVGLKRLFVESSITAKPFFLKLGFINPQEQQVLLRGVEFTNFRMEKFL